MITIVPLEQSHLDAIGEPQLSVYLNGTAWCALSYGEPVAAGGVCELYWPGRGHCWFARREHGEWNWRWWPAITRAVMDAANNALASGMCRRLEMTVRADDEAAKRWAAILGFRPEASCPKLMQDGTDGWIYARIE